MDVQRFKEVIETDRLLLKMHDFKRAADVFAAVEKNRTRLEEFLPWVPYVKTEKDSADYILRTHGWWETGFMFDLSLFRKSDLKFMGCVGVHNIMWEHHLAEIGYWIAEEFEGQGYVSEAVKGIETELFGLGFHRIEIHCSSRNERSAKVPQSSGYQLEARLKDHRKEHGKYCDTLIFSKINPM